MDLKKRRNGVSQVTREYHESLPKLNTKQCRCKCRNFTEICIICNMGVCEFCIDDNICIFCSSDSKKQGLIKEKISSKKSWLRGSNKVESDITIRKRNNCCIIC